MFGCKKPYTPTAYQGDVPLRIANHTDQQVCGFIMVPHGASNLENWLGTSKLAPNGETDFKIKPGAYDLVFTSCDNVHTGLIKGIQLRQATLLSYGGATPNAPAGFTVVAVGQGETHVPEGGACVSGACDPNGTACCSPNACLPDPKISQQFYCAEPK